MNLTRKKNGWEKKFYFWLEITHFFFVLENEHIIPTEFIYQN